METATIINAFKTILDAIIEAPVATVSAIAAIISAIGAIYSIRVTKKENEQNIESTEKISDQVQKAEDERNKAQIDANLVWNARIEWIQNVRRVTADFISACYSYLQNVESAKKECQESLLLVQKHCNLLVLYFGPDKPPEGKPSATDIYDLETNAGKNEEIVNQIRQIYKLTQKYFENICSTEFEQTILDGCKKCRDSEEPFCETDNCDTRQKQKTDNINFYKAEIRELKDNIDSLSEVMRIYLKREWDEAKNWDKKKT